MIITQRADPIVLELARAPDDSEPADQPLIRTHERGGAAAGVAGAVVEVDGCGLVRRWVEVDE